MDQQEVNRRFAEVNIGLDEVVSEIPRLTELPRLEGWNDAMLEKLRLGIAFRKFTLSRNALKIILSRFFNFYFHGEILENDTVPMIIADTIAVATTIQNYFIWPDDLYSDYTTPSFLANSNVPESLSLNAPGPFAFSLANLVLLNSDRTPVEEAAYRKLAIAYTENDMISFRALIIHAINNIQLYEEATIQEYRVQRLASFLALTLCRAATYNKNQLNNAFLIRRYRLNLDTIVGWSKEFPFSPPCTQCVEICITSLKKELSTTTNLFILLASQYVRSKKAPNDLIKNSSAATFLHASVLMHTARNGLEILQLLEQACLTTGLKWSTLLKLTYLNVTADAWETIKDFFLTYLRKDSLEYGYNWARIINDGYLRDYSLKYSKVMLPLAGIFAGIIEQVQNLRIWDEDWAKGQRERLKEMRIYGKVVYEFTKPTVKNCLSIDYHNILLKAQLEVTSREAK